MHSVEHLKQLLPECMDQVGENTYRCRNTNREITTGVLPIKNCGFCHSTLKQDKQDKQEKRFPPLKEQAKNLAKAVVDHVKSGLKNVPDEVYEERLGICNKCEFYQSGRCLKCGCFIGLKAHWSTQECPENKWLR
jgi:hypothetical protein